MKKYFTVYYGPTRSIRDEVKEAILKNRPIIEKDSVTCKDQKSWRNLTSPCKIELLQIINEYSPNSIMETAQIYGKDRSFVKRELDSLELVGVIRYEEKFIDGRGVKKPIALYKELLFRSEITSKKAS